MTSTVPPIIDQAAWDVGVMAQRLASEYYTHIAALHVAADPRTATFAPPVEPGEMVSVLRVPRDDGTCHKFAFDHFIADVKKPELLEDFKRSWLASSLLRIGDALGEHDYFQHAPEAELVRHLRNGVAHKNRLHFEMKNKKVVDPITGKLRYPAHNRRYKSSHDARICNRYGPTGGRGVIRLWRPRRHPRHPHRFRLASNVVCPRGASVAGMCSDLQTSGVVIANIGGPCAR